MCCGRCCRDGLTIDGALVTLELNASTIMLNDFDIDSQTIYSCLNFAYIESKNDKYGELVEFKNDSRNDKKLRFTKILKVIKVFISYISQLLMQTQKN